MLIQTIRHWIDVPVEEEGVITTLFEHQSIAANDFFLKSDSVCRFVGFIVQGLVRYYTLEDGLESTYDFSTPQKITCTYKSFLTQTHPSRYNQAAEDTTL